MATSMTVRTGASVDDFLDGIEYDRRRADAQAVCELMREVSGTEPEMWGTGIVGFGSRRLVSGSGRELDWFDIGFSPRKSATTLYFPEGVGSYAELLDRLGKHTTGVGCLYIKRLADVDPDVLEELLSLSIAEARRS